MFSFSSPKKQSLRQSYMCEVILGNESCGIARVNWERKEDESKGALLIWFCYKQPELNFPAEFLKTKNMSQNCQSKDI